MALENEEDFPMTVLVAECINEPRGDHGLEGYRQRDRYIAKLVPNKITRDFHYRIWPVAGDDYYETCSVQAFNKYFREVKDEQAN